MIFRPIKKFAIFCHRWMGLAFCLLFSWWFVSGIFMMYWDYPAVSDADRRDHSPVLDASRVHVVPAEAYAALDWSSSVTAVRLATFDGRPAYFFRSGRDEAIVYADDGRPQTEFPPEVNLRTAARWSGQPASAARVEPSAEMDQWTVGVFRRAGPFVKYTWPDGQQVYVSEATGAVAQATTRESRFFAYLGAIPHWLYFTPLRKNGPLWSKVVIWSSGAATVAALLGMIAGIWMYSPSKRYRRDGAPTSIPYSGQKRLHMILGLFVGIVSCTWAFSGMLSMDPFPQDEGRPRGAAVRIPAAFRAGRLSLADFAARLPQEALRQAANLRVKELELRVVGGEPFYLAVADRHNSAVIPVHGAPRPEFDRERLASLLRQSAQPEGLAELRVLDQYDAYYLDRHREQPLPVLLARLNDRQHTRFYVDPRTARIVGGYSANSWMERWLYHGLHSLNFPLLYNYRPAWDIVVLVLMLGGVWLCVTSVIIGWQLLQRKLAVKPSMKPAPSAAALRKA